MKNLNDQIDHDNHAQEEPEVLTGFGCLEQGEQRGRNETNDLKIGHETDDANQTTQADRHWKAYQIESDAEHEAVAQSHQSLTAEVARHAVLNVCDELGSELSFFTRNEVNPAVGIFFVVRQEEEEVEQTYERGDNVHDGSRCAPDHSPNLWHGFLDGFDDVALLKELLDFLLVGVSLQEISHGGRYGVVVCSFLDILNRHVFQVSCFFNHGRHDDIEESRERGAGQRQRQEDAEQAVLQSALILKETDDGIEQISHNPSDEEGNERRAQPVEQHADADNQHDADESANETVKRDDLGISVFGFCF